MSIKIRTDQRIFSCGRTGSGKSYLAAHVLRTTRRLAVLDGKGTLSAWDYTHADLNPAALRSLKKPDEEVRVRVVAPLTVDPGDFWGGVFFSLFHAGNVLVYIDEIYALVEPGAKPPPEMTAIYTRGRELGVGVWGTSQRPMWVPLFCMSEADHFFAFRLSLEEDRRRVAAFMGEEVEAKILDKHGFFYSSTEDENPQYFREYTQQKVLR